MGSGHMADYDRLDAPANQPSMQFACLFMRPKAPQLGDHVTNAHARL